MSEVTWAGGNGTGSGLDYGGELRCLPLWPVGEVSQSLLRMPQSIMRTGFVPDKDSWASQEALPLGCLAAARCFGPGVLSALRSRPWLVAWRGTGCRTCPEPSLRLEISSPFSLGFPHREQAAEPTPAPGEERVLPAETGRHLLGEYPPG